MALKGKKKKYLLWTLLVLLVVFGLIQLVPYGRDHSNPPVTEEPPWDSDGTRTMFMAVCGDCHSHETRWPWYSHVAPASWLVQSDVDEARRHFNVSVWDRPYNHSEHAAEMFRGGQMPLWYYKPAHPETWLSDDQRAELLAGLVATFGDEAENEHADDHEEHEH
jgi:hypothetical protein